ncbi:MAG: hypothetical protein Q4A71_07490 [Actinomycetaceae bacterium]|nr:hypothetical protein [Actinomycetaceae bacterium]
MRELNDIYIESSFVRFSIRVVGSSTGRGIFFTAIGAPVTVAAFGMIMNIWFPNFDLLGWYIFHLIYLLPFFGDGKAMIFGIRHWSSVIYLDRQPENVTN